MRELVWRDARIGLDAVLVIDDTTLGPAVGGTRTKTYENRVAMLRDAHALARAMTIKCAVAGLDAGGCKIVLDASAIVDRAAVFEELGRRIDGLDGEVRTAGDLGTTESDLRHAARHTTWVHLMERELAESTARGHLRCVEACAATRGKTITELFVAVQGCGAIGSAVASALAAAGARVAVADIDGARAQRLAENLGAVVMSPEGVLLAAVDVVAPCAIGGVLDREVASHMRAWAVVGAANNVLRSPSIADTLSERSIVFMPDVVASAGAVVDGVGATVMKLPDRTPLIDRLGKVASQVLERAHRDQITTLRAVEDMAADRLGKRLALHPHTSS